MDKKRKQQRGGTLLNEVTRVVGDRWHCVDTSLNSSDTNPYSVGMELNELLDSANMSTIHSSTCGYVATCTVLYCTVTKLPAI